MMPSLARAAPEQLSFGFALQATQIPARRRRFKEVASPPQDDIFRTIPGYARYLVAADGKVWDSYTGRLRNQYYTRQYQAVRLVADGRTRGRLVYLHHIVALAFLGPRPPYSRIRRRDGQMLRGSSWTASDLTYVRYTPKFLKPPKPPKPPPPPRSVVLRAFAAQHYRIPLTQNAVIQAVKDLSALPDLLGQCVETHEQSDTPSEVLASLLNLLTVGFNCFGRRALMTLVYSIVPTARNPKQRGVLVAVMEHLGINLPTTRSLWGYRDIRCGPGWSRWSYWYPVLVQRLRNEFGRYADLPLRLPKS